MSNLQACSHPFVQRHPGNQSRDQPQNPLYHLLGRLPLSHPSKRRRRYAISSVWVSQRLFARQDITNDMSSDDHIVDRLFSLSSGQQHNTRHSLSMSSSMTRARPPSLAPHAPAPKTLCNVSLIVDTRVSSVTSVRQENSIDDECARWLSSSASEGFAISGWTSIVSLRSAPISQSAGFFAECSSVLLGGGSNRKAFHLSEDLRADQIHSGHHQRLPSTSVRPPLSQQQIHHQTSGHLTEHPEEPMAAQSEEDKAACWLSGASFQVHSRATTLEATFSESMACFCGLTGSSKLAGRTIETETHEALRVRPGVSRY
ncbi:hypothetical protein KCU61_g120, partial [Aureobasidium melanogenum]